MAPFDSHAADPAELEEVAARLTNLAVRAVDQDRVTQQAFNPALDNWQGVAAPELRMAAAGVRNTVWEASGGVAWGAVPLRYWASQVRTFNSIARSLAFNLEENAGYSPRRTEEEIADWEEARAAARRQWWDAYEQHIEEGRTAVASMFNEGPTGENVARAMEVGAIAASPAYSALAAPWHAAHMHYEAGRAADLAREIVEAGPDASPEDLARLDDILRAYAGDPAFAYFLLNDLGPRDLLDLVGEIAMLPTYLAEPGGSPVNGEVAALVGSIQTSLGATLALATTRRGHDSASGYHPGRYELSDLWQQELLDQGRRRIEVGMADLNYSPYGYQLLGVLLRSEQADFDPHVLSQIGAGMLEFEAEHGGSDVWYEPVMDSDFRADVRLNWTGFAPGATQTLPPSTEIAGLDPVSGLMYALERDPEAGRRFFAGPDIELDGSQLSRVDYLLTDREWIDDRPPGPEARRDNDYTPPGLMSLGAALENATTEGYDRNSQRIVGLIIETVGGEARDGVVSETDLMPPELRQRMANIAAFWIGDLNQAVVADHDNELFDKTDTLRFLADLGKDDRARYTVFGATMAHADAGFAQAMVDGDLGGAESVAQRSATVLRALDFGFTLDSRHEIFEWQGQGPNPIVGIVQRGAMTYISAQLPVVGTTLNITGIPDAVAGQVNTWLAGEGPSVAEHNFEVGELMGDSQAAITDTFERNAAAAGIQLDTEENADFRDRVHVTYGSDEVDERIQDLDPD
jgi:hypothetical protein